MKKIYFLIVSLTIGLNTYGQSTEYQSGRWKLGLNIGSTFQSADIHTRFGLGYGFTLEYAIIQNDYSLLGLSVRGRFLQGRTYGQHYKLHVGEISNNNLNGVNDSLVNYSNLPYYKNNRTTFNEYSLELMLKLNSLYQNTGILFYWYLGGGLTDFTPETDQLDASGNMYDYSGFQSGDKNNVSNLLNMQDGNYETTVDYQGLNTSVFTPTTGIGIGFRLAPGISMAFEHKISLPQTDLFDGQLYKTDDPSFVQDVYHYTSLGFTFDIFRGSGHKNIHQPVVEPVGTNFTPVDPTEKPTITLQSPTGTSFTNCTVTIVADIKNVTTQADIEFYQNGNKRPGYSYFYTPTTFKSTVTLEPGDNTFKIIAKNKIGIEEKNFVLNCNNNNQITICHKNVDGSSQTLVINQSEWAIHQAHGDVQGACVENKITICHNTPSGGKQTISINESEWPTHMAHGDKKGSCFTPAAKTINICHNNLDGSKQNLTIDETEWPIHQAHGDIQGNCPTVKMITICHVPPTGNSRITMTIPENEWIVHQAHGDVLGTCPPVEPTTTICHNNNGVKQTLTIPSFRWPEHMAHGDQQGPCPENTIIICHIDPVTKKKSTIAIAESLWPQHQAHGDIIGQCQTPEKDVTICHKNPNGTQQTMVIKESQLNIHLAHGDFVGACPVVDKDVTICHKNPNGTQQTMVIKESQLNIHLAHGDFVGACPVVDKDVTICHKNPNGTQQTMVIKESQLNAHLAHGDFVGACPVVDKDVTICHKNPDGTQQTMVIKESQLNAHLAHGDFVGNCPKETRMVICHKNPDGSEQTMTISNNQWPLHQAHGDVQGTCVVDKDIVICHHKQTPTGQIAVEITIKESEWPQHAAHGDTKGPCPSNSGSSGGNSGGNEKITICHYPPGNTTNPQTIEIPASAWPAHQAHGDTKGSCRTNNSGGGNSGGTGNSGGNSGGSGNSSEKVKVCHYDKRKNTWTTIEIPAGELKTHLAHGDYQGTCNTNTKGKSQKKGSTKGKINSSVKPK